ncbi:hypothetical protein BKD26_36665 [Streptomyces sp. CB03238]|nr:hypothetical protein BKD26_36665 [Streptomyces sp. CB03238]
MVRYAGEVTTAPAPAVRPRCVPGVRRPAVCLRQRPSGGQRAGHHPEASAGGVGRRRRRPGGGQGADRPGFTGGGPGWTGRCQWGRASSDVRGSCAAGQEDHDDQDRDDQRVRRRRGEGPRLLHGRARLRDPDEPRSG